jgi:hypothetical protein
MSFRRTISTIAVAATTVGGLALGGSAVATASPSGKSAPNDHAGPPCGRTVVQALTTTLSSGDPQAMTLAVTLNQDVGRLVAVVGNSDGVLEYGPLAPVSGQPGSYTGIFVPPSGTPVANGDTVLVIACGDHWLTRATVGTAWTAGHPGKSGEPTRTPDGPPAGPRPTTTQPPSGCIGAQILSVTSALTADGTGVTVTITVNQSLGRSFSAYVESGGQMVAGGAIADEAGQPGSYQVILTAGSGATIPADAQVVFGSCGGTPNRIGGTTTLGSATWSSLK